MGEGEVRICAVAASIGVCEELFVMCPRSLPEAMRSTDLHIVLCRNWSLAYAADRKL